MMPRPACVALLAAAACARRLSEGYIPPEQRAQTRIEPERYTAMGGFEVSAGREAAFERSWAARKSRLGLIEGFRFFSLLRRVAGPDVRGNLSAWGAAAVRGAHPPAHARTDGRPIASVLRQRARAHRRNRRAHPPPACMHAQTDRRANPRPACRQTPSASARARWDTSVRTVSEL